MNTKLVGLWMVIVIGSLGIPIRSSTLFMAINAINAINQPKKHCCPLTCARLTGYGAFAPHAILADLLKQERNGQAPLSIASAVPLGKEFWVNTQQAKSPSHNSLVSGSGIFWKHVLWMRFVYMCFVVAATASVVLR